MNFDTVFEDILDKISNCAQLYTKEQLRNVLNFYRDNKSDFVIYFNQISTSPCEDAKKLYDSLIEKKFAEIESLKLGEACISFDLNKRLYYKGIIENVYRKGASFGKSSVGSGQTVVVDYSSPNVAKIFHVGHFRTTVLGQFIVNLMRSQGYKTVSLNYLGDWGTQFGFVLLGYEMYGNKEELERDALTHLFQIYVKISGDAKNDPEVQQKAKNIFREMDEFKNEKYLKLWSYFREMSIRKYKELYSVLGIEFDVYSGESFYQDRARVFAETTSLAVIDEDGSKVVDCENYGKALIAKSDGTTLYLTRDICAAMDRIETYKADKLLYVISSEQDLHMNQLFKCMEMLGYERSKFEHINFGLVKGMSTRRGTVHFIEDIIEQSAEAIKARVLANKNIPAESMERTAKILAISTLLIADFSAKRIKGYTFNYEQRANCEKGSGAYLQYAHCRLNSVEENNTDVDLTGEINFSVIDIPEIHEMAYKLMWYEKVLRQCLEDYEPSRIVLYLMDLARISNNLVDKLRVKGEDLVVARPRLMALKACRIVIMNGLALLGVQPLDRM